PHAGQHWRKLYTTRMARRAGGSGHTFQTSEHLGANLTDEGHIQRVRKSLARVTIEYNPFAIENLQLPPKVLPQFAYARHRLEVVCKRASFAEGGCQHHALCPSSKAMLVARAMNQCLQRCSFAHIQRADALRRIELVTCDTKKVYVKIINARSDFSG